MTIEQFIKHLQAGESPEFKVVIEGHDDENSELLFEPCSIRWGLGSVVIEADLIK